MKTTGTWDCACVNIARTFAILDRCSDLDWNRWHVTLFTSPFSKVSVFTCLHEKQGVFKRLHFWNRFWKSPSLSAFSGVLVWTIGETHQKVCVFKRKRISVDGAWTVSISDLPFEWTLPTPFLMWVHRVKRLPFFFSRNWESAWSCLSQLVSILISEYSGPSPCDHLSWVTTFPKYQIFVGQITIVGASRKRLPLVGDPDHF